MGASDLAELLRSLKERSGLSYGVLAKRLHVSTSTLHRYCNGSTVPTEFAPVERLARLCKATPEELIQVHRQWILADAARGRKPQADGASADAAQPEPTAPAEEAAMTPIPDVAAAPPGPAGTPSSGPTPPASSNGRPQRAWRPRKAVLAALAVTCVMGSAALAVGLAGGGDDGKGPRPPGASSSRGTEVTGPGKPGKSGTSPVATPSSPKEKQEKESGEPAASAGPDGTVSPSPAGKQDGGDDKGGDDQGDAPLTVHTRPYAYESPCSQSFLVNRPPDQMPKPPIEQDAPAWVSELGAVTADHQFVKVTLQGTGTHTVVLEELHVRVDGTNAPLAWNTYAAGVGCGGDVATRSFGVDLDAGSPALTPMAGQRAFPYKVSRTDPEVFYVKADVKQHDVRWHLEVQWSSGSRRGVLRIDDQGRPFHTSGSTGRPSYQQPPGDTRWSPAPQG
ncbi:helix-turn-helix domain-containing protein [Streptomyces sp. ISL-11]|uniref:helix-turn-helix domain-containing protein n=1 Tax=Streptomyces sp. ISL-11 TaxID=2819174 RepID=UPI0027E56240|nr:helix-turn-helix domain-containing protein [Streptomyces sp. ISL-11]